MSLNLICTICADPYLPHRHDYLDVCTGCLGNVRASVVHDPPDALHVSEDLATRLLLEQATEEAQRLDLIRSRTPRLWR